MYDLLLDIISSLNPYEMRIWLVRLLIGLNLFWFGIVDEYSSIKNEEILLKIILRKFKRPIIINKTTFSVDSINYLHMKRKLHLEGVQIPFHR